MAFLHSWRGPGLPRIPRGHDLAMIAPQDKAMVATAQDSLRASQRHQSVRHTLFLPVYLTVSVNNVYSAKGLPRNMV